MGLVSGQTIDVAATLAPRLEGSGRSIHAAASPRRPWYPWAFTAVLLLALSIVLVAAAGIRPSFDPYGWLVWGHQALHGTLDTNGEPSWKPLPFLFTLPYALAGRGQLWLWMVTAVAVSLSGPLFAGRIAHRLTGVTGRRRYAPIAAALAAGLGLLMLRDYANFTLTATSDPMCVALCLAAIDSHQSRRPRVAFVCLVLAALVRPEAWAFVGLYALWAWRAVESSRGLLVAGLAVIPPAWFVVPALTSRSWFIAGDIAQRDAPSVHGSRIVGVVDRFVHLCTFPIYLAALVAIVLAVRRRDRATLLLAGAAVLWVVIEIGFALHGWSGSFRYQLEPGAVTVVLAGSAVGRILADSPSGSGWAGWAGPAVVIALAAAAFPGAQRRVNTAVAELSYERGIARQIDRLHAVIVTRGGTGRILACGRPVTEDGFQSVLAWELGQNVVEVGEHPSASITSGQSAVVFQPYLLGWEIRAIHPPAAERAACADLSTITALN